MGFCGSCGQEHPGETCQNGTANGRRSTAAFNVGARPGSGTKFSKDCKVSKIEKGWWIGKSILSMAQSCAPTSMPLGQKKQLRKRGFRPLAGWVEHQNPPTRGWQRPNHDLFTDARANARNQHGRKANGARGCEPSPRSSPPASQTHCRR